MCRILHDGLKAVILGHLSKENNLPELAYESVRVEVTMACMNSGGEEKEPGNQDFRFSHVRGAQKRAFTGHTIIKQRNWNKNRRRT